ncbi:unnamed protein product [Dimorphilus gyrociliatus]|uniref:Uncharacterized protein n=1 Tax=Dimorphilus gyrociliatus TaxID=2664684 RepID=A0A7I8VPG5_9ANNE|nr:unnamed protein product [Dimorphilus gyrociliatus]
MTDERNMYRIKNYVRNLDNRMKREHYETRNFIFFQVKILKRLQKQEARLNRLCSLYTFLAAIFIGVCVNIIYFYFLRGSLTNLMEQRTHYEVDEKSVIKQSRTLDLLYPELDLINKTKLNRTDKVFIESNTKTVKSSLKSDRRTTSPNPIPFRDNETTTRVNLTTSLQANNEDLTTVASTIKSSTAQITQPIKTKIKGNIVTSQDDYKTGRYITELSTVKTLFNRPPKAFAMHSKSTADDLTNGSFILKVLTTGRSKSNSKVTTNTLLINDSSNVKISTGKLIFIKSNDSTINLERNTHDSKDSHSTREESIVLSTTTRPIESDVTRYLKKAKKVEVLKSSSGSSSSSSSSSGSSRSSSTNSDLSTSEHLLNNSIKTTKSFTTSMETTSEATLGLVKQTSTAQTQELITTTESVEIFPTAEHTATKLNSTEETNLETLSTLTNFFTIGSSPTVQTTTERHLLDLNNYQLKLTKQLFEFGKFIYDIIISEGNLYYVAKYDRINRGLYVMNPEFGAIEQVQVKKNCKLRSITITLNGTIVALCSTKNNIMEGVVISSHDKGANWEILFSLDYSISQIRSTADGMLIVSTTSPCDILGLHMNGTIVWKTNITADGRANIAIIDNKVAVADIFGIRGILLLDSTDGSIFKTIKEVNKNSYFRNVYLLGHNQGLLLCQKKRRTTKISIYTTEGKLISNRNFNRLYSAAVFSNGTETLFLAGQYRIDAFTLRND